MSSASVILAHGRPERSRIVETTIITAPASFNATLVVAENWNPGVQWTIGRWPAIHGNTLPATGAMALIVLTDQGNRVCIWWDGEHS